MSAYERYDNKAGEKRWHYRKRITLPDGRKTRVWGTPSLNTKRAAEEAERAHVERVLNPPKPVRLLRRFSELFDKLLSEYAIAKNNKPSEIESKRSAIDHHLRPELGKLSLDELTEERLQTLIATLRATTKANGETISAKTVKNVLQVLRKALRWAKKLKWIADPPEIDMPRIDEQEVRFLTDDELAALLEAATAEPKWYAMLALGVDAGLRKGEIRALKWTDVNEVTGVIVLSRSTWRRQEASTKSRKPRSVPITKRLCAALKAIKSASKLRGPYVISRDDGLPYGGEHLADTLDRLVRKAKLADVGLHTLRHTFGARLAMRGAPPKMIQELMGHANITTTMRYMHLVAGSTAQAIALLDEDDRARAGHASDTDVQNEAEAGAIVQFNRATRTGFEP